MDCIDTNFKSCDKNIAFDESLLAEAESGKINKTLRIWEVKDYAVVLGRGCDAKDDVFINRCKKDNVKIIKRISGGGTVLLGKGCLNYSLVIPYNSNAKLSNITDTYNFLLGCIRSAFLTKGLMLTHFPPSDLALGDKKVSGNAQARRKNALLFHGTFLYDFDIDRIGFYLREPKKTPEYRCGRPHNKFLTNLPLSFSGIKEIIRGAKLP